MHGRSLIVALLMLSGSLAGCIGGNETSQSGDEEIQQANTTPIENGTIDTETIEGDITVSAATPAVSVNFNAATASGPFVFDLERPSNATGYVLEATWEPTTPASQSLDIWVRKAGEGNVPPNDPMDPLPAEPAATATGESPLKLAVADGDLEPDTDYQVYLRAPSDMGVGVTVQQPFTLHVSTFEDKPFDPGYSAVDNGTAAR